MTAVAPVSCSLCGRSVSEPRLGWMVERDPRRGQVWLCETCARENLRAIEAKLDREWW